MNTTTGHETSVENVTGNERAFRTLAGMGMLTLVVTRIIVPPADIFTVSTMASYLVITSILGIDPTYYLAQRLRQLLIRPRYKPGRASA